MHDTAIIKKPLLDPRKFRDPALTAEGERRARVKLRRLDTLWFNTGTLCNLACRNCYIESSPRNDRLVYLSHAEVRSYLDEIERESFRTKVIGFTGGEPFMNPDMPAMLEEVLARGFEALVLTNAMKPMMKMAARLLDIRACHGDRLTMRVSIDHYTKALHELERGAKSWTPALEGLRWLTGNGFVVHLAGRLFSGEPEAVVRKGFAQLLKREGIRLDAHDPGTVVLFPEMDAQLDVAEISEACWEKLGTAPEAMMCASSRMVVKRKGAAQPAVVACTLLPYDSRFELGHTLAESTGEVSLNHPHCARFCVLGGGSCSAQ